MAGNTGWSDERVESVIGNLLRVGVVVAALLVVTGGAIYLFQHGADRPDRAVFHGEPAGLRSPAGVVREAAGGSPRGLIQLGLLALIATPIARVAFSVYAFLRQHDYLYVVVTVVVLSLLLFSLSQ